MRIVLKQPDEHPVILDFGIARLAACGFHPANRPEGVRPGVRGDLYRVSVVV
jgi:hypothetical protein